MTKHRALPCYCLLTDVAGFQRLITSHLPTSVGMIIYCPKIQGAVPACQWC